MSQVIQAGVAPVFDVAPGAPEVAVVVLETAPGIVAPVIALFGIFYLHRSVCYFAFKN